MWLRPNLSRRYYGDANRRHPTLNIQHSCALPINASEATSVSISLFPVLYSLVFIRYSSFAIHLSRFPDLRHLWNRQKKSFSSSMPWPLFSGPIMRCFATPRVTSKGKNTNAQFGFTNTLIDLINNQKPTHMAVCFEGGAPAGRMAEFAEYKANRQESPEDLVHPYPILSGCSRLLIFPYLNLKVLRQMM
jgi:hypothetical protein